MLNLFLTFLMLLMPIVSESEIREASIDKKDVYISSGTVQGGEITDGMDIRDIRWSKHITFERIVLHIYKSEDGKKGLPAPVPCHFEIEYEQRPFRLVFTLSGVRRFSATFPKLTGSNLINDIHKIIYPDNSVAKFAVELKEPIEYEVFELHNPAMIVVDIRPFELPSVKQEERT